MSASLLSKFRKRIPGEISKFIRDITSSANNQGLKLFLVGGIVRDLLLNRPNHDVDLVLEGAAIKFARELAAKKRLSAIFHPRFGTAKFRFDDFSVDLASSRRELYIRPGVLPSVYKGTITEDLARRDFTINAIAVRLSTPEQGKIIDPYHGIQDIELKLIRVLHDRSFVDDATRIFRAIRYEQRLNFNIEPNTFKLIQNDIDMLDTLSADRIRNELQLFLLEKYPEKMIYRSFQLGVLNRIYPPLRYNDLLIKSYKKARSLFKPAQLPSVYLCLLIFHLDTVQLGNFLNKYNFSRQQTLKMKQTVELKNRLGLPGSRPERRDIFHVLVNYEPVIIQINKIAANDNKLSRIINQYLNKVHNIKPQLTGKDLVALGVPEGPQIGHILNSLHMARINGEIKSEAQETKMVRRLLREKPSV